MTKNIPAVIVVAFFVAVAYLVINAITTKDSNRRQRDEFDLKIITEGANAIKVLW